MDVSRSILVYFVVVAFTSESCAKRDFEIVLNYCNCTYNATYGVLNACYVDKNLTPPAIIFDVQNHHEVLIPRYSLEVTLLKKNKDRYTLFNSTDNDICLLLSGEIGVTFIKIVREAMENAGRIPKKCPIPKDFHWQLRGLKPDAEQFPPYVPETQFHINVYLTDGSYHILKLELDGDVRHIQRHRWVG